MSPNGDSKLVRHENPLMPRTRRTSPVNLSESRTGNSSSRASSCGSCVQPSIGIPLANTSLINILANKLVDDLSNEAYLD
jgi:hypothetical protein